MSRTPGPLRCPGPPLALAPVAQPWAAHARRAGPHLPCTYSSVTSATPSPAWELTPRAGTETVATVPRAVSAA